MRNTIKVTGITTSINEEILVLFFENTKRSDGGEVSSSYLALDNSYALITFTRASGKFTMFT